MGYLDRQVIASFAVKSAHALLSIVVTWMFARSLSVDDFGRFSMFQAVASLCAVFVVFGVDQHLVRRGSLQTPILREYVFAILVISVNSLVVSLAAAVLLHGAFAMAAFYSVFLGVYVFLLCFVRVSRGVLVGQNYVFGGLLPEAVIGPVVCIGVIGLTWLTDMRIDFRFAVRAILIAIAAASVVAIVQTAALGIHRNGSPSGSSALAQLRATLTGGFPLMMLAFGNVALSQSDVIMLGLVGDAEAAGIGRVLIRIADFGPFALMAAAVPVSRLIAPLATLPESRRELLLRRIVSFTVAATAFALVFSVVVIVFSDQVLGVFGEAYRGYSVELGIILFSRVVFCLFGFPTIYLAMSGRGLRVAAVQVAVLLLNVGLNFALIPRYGVLGAAIATATTVIVWKGLVYLDVRNNFGVELALRGRMAGSG